MADTLGFNTLVQSLRKEGIGVLINTDNAPTKIVVRATSGESFHFAHQDGVSTLAIVEPGSDDSHPVWVECIELSPLPVNAVEAFRMIGASLQTLIGQYKEWRAAQEGAPS